MGNPAGCLIIVLVEVFFPFIGGTMFAFARGGWIWGVGSIIYTIFTFWLCSVIRGDKVRGGVYFLMMLPFYIAEFFALQNFSG
jgi:hypothetical protein